MFIKRYIHKNNLKSSICVLKKDEAYIKRNHLYFYQRMKKYYVIREGSKTGIFTSWDECKEFVVGVKNARYKAFPTKEAAEEALKH